MNALVSSAAPLNSLTGVERISETDQSRLTRVLGALWVFQPLQQGPKPARHWATFTVTVSVIRGTSPLRRLGLIN